MTNCPLAGVRVLDLAGEPLAAAGRMLADLGADVVLVEPPGGSEMRRVPPLVRNASGVEVSPYFLYTAAGKRSVTADLESPAGYELLVRLVKGADIVLVSEDAQTLMSRKLDYPSLRAVNERIVFTSLTPFGSNGPRRGWRGSDLVAWASSGALLAIGEADRPPVAPGGGLAHVAGSLNAVAGSVMALRSRTRSGRGQMVDISLQEAVLSVSMEGGPLYSLEGASQARVGSRRGTASGHFPTKDGFVEILPFMPGQWDALAQWMRDELGVEEATMEVFRGSVATRIPFADLIDPWVEQLTSRYAKRDFFIEAQRRGIPCGPVNEPADLLEDPHLEAVGAWEVGDLPGMGPLRQPRSPVRFGSVPTLSGQVPEAGEHNADIYGGELGLSVEDLAALRVDHYI